MKKILKYSAIIFSIWFFAHIIFITFDGLNDEEKHADIAVILGNKVNEDATLSERLEARMNCGLQLFKNKRVKKILVSGGFGKEGFFEGTKMKEFFITK